jgi:hypothetical protein
MCSAFVGDKYKLKSGAHAIVAGVLAELSLTSVSVAVYL